MAVPETVPEMCRRDLAAVLVYDAQVGILQHIRDRDQVVSRMRLVLDAARGAGAPVFYVRHVSLPPSHLGVGALRTAMAWQRLADARKVISAFPPEAPASQLVGELSPRDGE
ncbi:MAG: isochorismatase family protein, partial [Candidatus Dormibacteraeota bacterium]|nr:isochorismatase family protein [Candidatus Dormibacteraeota bacterium]